VDLENYAPELREQYAENYWVQIRDTVTILDYTCQFCQQKAFE
jgi:hypothetical protein